MRRSPRSSMYLTAAMAAVVDFVAPTIRGYIPGKEQYDGGGDTRKLAGLVAAINRAGAADRLKISALDDTPASLTDRRTSTSTTPADTARRSTSET